MPTDDTAAPGEASAGPLVHDATAPTRAVPLLVGLAAAVVVVAGVRSFSATIGPAVLALVLVLVVHPVEPWLRRRGVYGWVSTLVVLVVLYTVVFGLAAALGWSLVRLAMLLPQYTSRYYELQGQVLELLDRLGVGQSQITQAVASIDPSRFVGLAQTVLEQFVAALTAFSFLLFLLFFLALDAAVFPKLLAQASWWHPRLVGALTAFAAGTRRYLLVATAFGVVVAVIDIGILYWLAVPLPLVWGLLAFLTNYIANIGFFLGLVPPALVALLDSGPRDALLVVVLYTVVNVTIQGLLQPKIVGNAVGLSATLTFLSVIFWGWALGSLGALLAVPLSLLVRTVLVDADPSARWLLPLVSGNPRGVRRQGVRLGRTGAIGATVAPPAGSEAPPPPPPPEDRPE
ncbi:AI-2E family transporter [Paenibacillus sp. TRM 82003]|uniref:AI-2E family transporter n=1 Tax=Kineococcus sp. TRM81007 TaxID=2925831 RepID=UPI001F58C9F0|nr:AI-2E family transporter [Kineococcus sp. TRM81007]MCI2237180.1 AI-2E family transporter [Kineococcus sp. TRM81007]MCI3925301.1 AI-2E family transporter [Paenibacillus sp. TRM 82003]